MKKKDKNQTKSTYNPATLLIPSKSSFAVQEAYKTLRTNVTFSLPGTDCKCIGITSANRGEGKSTIAVNLTISLAQLNKRVILIDCDLRLPTVVTKFNIKESEGLSNYLSGAIDEVPVINISDLGVDIIPSGNIPPDATTLINSEAMINLLNHLKDSYDYIVLDFPPINIVSDAVLLSALIDGYLLVVRHGFSENKKITEALRQMQLADAKIIGFVYNGKSNDKKYYRRKNYYKKNYYRYEYRSGYYK